MQGLHAALSGAPRDPPRTDRPGTPFAKVLFALLSKLQTTRIDIPTGAVGNEVVAYSAELLNKLQRDPEADPYELQVFWLCVFQRDPAARSYKQQGVVMKGVVAAFRAGKAEAEVKKAIARDQAAVRRSKGAGRGATVQGGEAAAGDERLAARFERLALGGRVSKAVQLATSKGQETRVLAPTDVVTAPGDCQPCTALDELRQKQPPAAPSPANHCESCSRRTQLIHSPKCSLGRVEV